MSEERLKEIKDYADFKMKLGLNEEKYIDVKLIKELYNEVIRLREKLNQRNIAGIQVVVSEEAYNEYKGTLQDQISELENRIDKAIEYIVNTPLYTTSYDYNMEDNLELNYVSDEKASDDLLNILRGDDK